MKNMEIPMTPSVRMLRAAAIPFKPHFYNYVDQDVAIHAAAALGVPEHEVVKTLVMEYVDGAGKKSRLLVLMHADREVSTKQLARLLGAKTVAPARRADVERSTGYKPGGVSPFGTRSPMPVHVESTVLAMPRMYVNGGKRGFMVEKRRTSLLAAAVIGVSAAAGAVEHPFVLWTRDEAAAIRATIRTESWATNAYNEMLGERGRGGTFRNLFRYVVMGDRQAGETEKQYLLGIVGTHPRQFEKLESGGRHYDCYLDVLRYDGVYDLLDPEERQKVEATFREYVAYQLQDTKVYTRTSWLPNMQWPRPMAAFMMAMVLQDRALIEQTWNSRCGLKWYLDEYVADGQFYMEEFGKQYSMTGELLLYARGLRRQGLDALGYGYRGRGGATVRSYIESIVAVGYPRIDTGTDRPHYPKITMGDARGGGGDGAPPYLFQHAIVNGQFAGRTNVEPAWVAANMNGRDHKNTKIDKLGPVHWFEMAHALWPDAGFDYFLAQMRPPGAATYVPSLFWGLQPMDPAAVKPPPAPSYVAPERGFAFLRAEESAAYWSSPAPAAALQLGQYYVHYTHDCFSLLGFVAFNRPIYLNRGISDGYAGGDPWTDSGRGHSGPVVDGLQPKPVGQLPVRSRFDALVKFAAVTDDPAAGPRTATDDKAAVGGGTVYPGVRTQRALFLTRDYLLDITRLAGEAQHVYDWQVHALGLPQLEDAGWRATDELDGGALYAQLPEAMAAKAKGDTARYDLKDVRRLDADGKPWTADVVQRCALPSVADSVMGAAWYDRQVGVRVRMLPEPGIRVYVGRSAEYVRRTGAEPGKSTRGGANEVGGTTVLVRREAPSAVFVALHEPFERATPRIEAFSRILQDERAVAVLVRRGPEASDRIGFQYGPDLSAPVSVAEDGETLTFRDHAFVRREADRVAASGGIQSLRLPARSFRQKPGLTVNGQMAAFDLRDGLYVYERP